MEKINKKIYSLCIVLGLTLLCLTCVNVNIVNAEETNLIGEWHFDEGTGGIVVDSSGNGNNGTINGATWTTGKIDSALNFDGVDDYVDCGNDASLNITEAITIEAWVKPELLAGSGEWHGGTIVGAYDSNWHRYGINSYGVFYRIYNGTDAWYKQKAYSFNTGTWYHVVVVGDKANNKGYWYVNGEEIGNESKTVWPIHTYCQLRYIGSTDANRFLNGTIDEVRIYNRALSADEIKADYQEGITGGTISGTVTNTSFNPIQGAAVTANGYSTTTNSTGGYTITNIPIGNYTVTASATGY
ncbi:MAG: carboxypeptidase regulatory-like domain-containing protein, partial [Methanophagales archaeon]|nr:carboxypeptidase regulatory-like domain-containing protein [Methanophagales archaeon]